jgi:hypothetical protein
MPHAICLTEGPNRSAHPAMPTVRFRVGDSDRRRRVAWKGPPAVLMDTRVSLLRSTVAAVVDLRKRPSVGLSSLASRSRQSL